MMTSDGARLCVGSVVVTNHKTIDGIGVLLGGNLMGECSDTTFYRNFIRIGYRFSFYRCKPLGIKPIHPLSPRRDVVFSINQGKGNPLDMTSLHLIGIFQRQRT